ncbi:MAG: DUF4381 family protein, partial [Gammaproteobacteria bacterium]|nr:DUF4381 family protein [Gammaproteobacteria bacterium]
MNPELQALRDIHDPLGNPWWPLAPGWWLVLLALCAAAVLIWRQRRHRPLLPPLPLLRVGDWRWDAHRQLKRLQRAAPSTPIKVRAAELAELLKRIAMARHGRAHCAGLHGQAWLDWLTEQDPEGFDWRQEGQVLIRAPYAPPEHSPGHPGGQTRTGANAAISQADQQQLERLLDAAERWIIVKPRTGRTRRLRWLPLRGKLPTPVQASAAAAERGAKAGAK